MSQQKLYIPPKGIYFRLLGYKSNEVLFSRTHNQPEVGQIPQGDSQYDDQLFTLIHGTGSHKELYAIKSKDTGRVLFSRTYSPNVGHIEGDGVHEDKWVLTWWIP